MSDTTPQRPDGLNENTGTQQQPRVQVEPTPVSPQGANPVGAHTAPGAASSPELMSRTVVKTRTKKFPVFLSALGGLAVGAVLVIALVMSGGAWVWARCWLWRGSCRARSTSCAAAA